MGILGNQQDRSTFAYSKVSVIDLLNEIKNVAKSTGLSADQVLKAYEIKEYERRTNAYVENGDYKDEQMGGFGELFQDLNALILGLSNNIEKLRAG